MHTCVCARVVMPLTRVGKWAVVYGVVAVEVGALTGAYHVWHNMNTRQGEREREIRESK